MFLSRKMPFLKNLSPSWCKPSVFQLSLILDKFNRRMNRALMGNGLLATLGTLYIEIENRLGKTMFLGDHHKKQRKILNPFFSAKHMRELLPIFWPVTQKVSAGCGRRFQIKTLISSSSALSLNQNSRLDRRR